MLGFVQILGGLALFLFGINLLSSGMEKLAGDQIQKWLDRVTGNLLKSAIFGTAATALLQSSGLLMVTMMGLINANLMTVAQAIGVMLGQEIGTTLTAQIVAFEIGNFRLILVILGWVFLEFFPRARLEKIRRNFDGPRDHLRWDELHGWGAGRAGRDPLDRQIAFSHGSVSAA